MEAITLTTVTTAATIFCIEIIKKPGADLGQFVSNRLQNSVNSLVAKLKGKSEKIVSLLETNQRNSQSYSEAILELKALAEKNPELAQDIIEVAEQANQESNPQFQNQLQEVKKEIEVNKLENQHVPIQNSSKLSENIGVVNQAPIRNQNITQNF